ncbi:hypothetical protein BJY16_009265 [Actinoplanes octamycinicus]|uniref:DUF4034 domain-containing protein n=1 Tax=Actinoplanes octamycinicus TaxID=135948 RepID=A0A7W7H855_9ACTN|nr:hypothetical protein [Actinoplanes octamycinicus]MBB4745806.1 hypothetical protein [Actinoplanes octamycinicus]GIE63608.1 hypothetical protein Aoc01nite_90100 [Actinoplanes octamycinicus]
MWPFKKQTEPQTFRYAQSTELLAHALEQRDWPTARDILTAADPEHLMVLMRWAAHTKGVEEWIPEVIRAEPDATLPLLVRGARAVIWAWEARGGGTADTVGQDQWKVWFQRLKLAENCLDDVVDRDPRCAEAWHYLIILGRARQLPVEESWRRFGKLADIDPTHLYGHEQMLQNLMPKWSGSTEEMFDFARTRAAACPGTDVPVLIAQAHREHRRSAGGAAYLRRTEVAGEIYAAAHNSFWHPDYQRSRSTVAVWNEFAYGLTIGRYDRAACAVFDLIGDKSVTTPWGSRERFEELRDRARDRADDLPPDTD